MSISLGTALLIGGGIKGLTSLGKTWYGSSQRRKGLKRQREAEAMWQHRPQMEVPESVNEMVRLFRQQAGMQRLPGQDIIEGNIRGSTATGIEAAKDLSGGAGGLGAVTQMIAGEQDRFSDLGINLAEMVERGKGRLAGALGQKGGWEQRAWEWNKAMPWQRRYGEAYGEGQAREGAGIQNIWSGITGAGTAASDMLIGGATGKGGVGGGGEEGLASLFAQLKQIFPFLGGGNKESIATGNVLGE